jgi:hypothetical protein
MVDSDETDGVDGTDDEFDELRARATEAIDGGDDVRSMYVGLVREDGAKEYYFGNTVDEEELRRTAASQLGMMLRVLADHSASTVEEVGELAVEQAESMDRQP